jgi:UDP-glucose 4-epimerase
MKRTAIVTGASGFLARNLIAHLEEQKWEVLPVSRKPGPNTMSWQDFWASSILNETVVFHLAAYVPSSMEDSSEVQQCIETNAMLSLRLAEFLASQKNVRLVYGSTGQFYRYQTEPANEQCATDPSARACFYLSSKLLGETFVERTRKVRHLDAVSLRIGSCYGPGMSDQSLIARFTHLATAGKPLILRNGGVEHFDMVHVEDVVSLLIRAATSTAQGVFIAGSGQSISVREIAAAVNHASRNPAGFVIESGTTLPTQLGFAPLCMRKSIAAFGFKPRAFEEGIVHYLQSHEHRNH